MVECFVIYLAGHNRPPHEVLVGNDKDIAGEYERAFIGMTEAGGSLETMLDARARMRGALPQRPSTEHRQFVSGLASAEHYRWPLEFEPNAQLPTHRPQLANRETCPTSTPPQSPP